MGRKFFIILLLSILAGGILLSQSRWLPSDKRLDTDLAGQNISRFPQITGSGDYIYVVWQDDRNGSDDIFFNYSTNGGASWQSTDIQINTNTPGSSESVDPQIYAEDNYIFIVWGDSRNGNWYDVYLNYSLDYGTNWQTADLRINHQNSDARSPKISFTGSRVYIVWQDFRNGLGDIYFNYSIDNGTSWQITDARLDTDLAGAGSSWEPGLCVTGDNLYVVWQDNRNGNWDIYVNYSHNGGVDWNINDVKIDSSPEVYNSFSPQLCCNGMEVYVCWLDDRNGENDLYFNSSLDGGETWQGSDIRVENDLPGMNRSRYNRIYFTGEIIYLIWIDDRNTSSDLFLNHSFDSGFSWLDYDIRIDTDDTSGELVSPCITANNHNVFLAWEDYRDSLFDNGIYFNYSLNIGNAWHYPDIRLDSDTPGDSRSSKPQIFSSPERVWVVWEDDRNGNRDIYLNTTNELPQAVAGPDQSVEYESRVYLDGSDSYDPDGDDLRFFWQFISVPIGSTTKLYQERSKSPWFRADQIGKYEIELTLQDPFGGVDREKVTIRSILRLYPPINFEGKKVANYSLSQVEYLNELTWQHNPLNESTKAYRLYLLNEDVWILHKEFKGDTFKYWHRNVDKKTVYQYALTTIDHAGQESRAEFLSVQ